MTRDMLLPLPRIEDDPEAYCRGIFSQYEQSVSDYLVSKGQPPLAPRYRGRTNTVDVVIKRTAPAPVPRGRQGEVTPGRFHPSLQYGQRFKQLRRLQALVHSTQKGSSQPSAVEYRACLWASILGSSGFEPSFTLSCLTRPVQLVGDPPSVPLEPPPLQTVRSFFANVRHLERKKAQQFRNDAKAARRNNPSLIFRDLQEPLAQSVETLLECSEAEISGIDQADLSITLATDIHFRDDLPLLTKHGPISIVHAEPDKVWRNALPAVAEGDLVRQERYLGSLTDIFRAFGDAWSRRWLKHEILPDARWDEILARVQGVPVDEHMSYVPITLPMWRQAVRDKHPRTSAGPDGISRLDLLAMPDDLTILVIDICHYAEATGRWPRSALQGVVTAIQKAQSSASVGDFRPITIFSLSVALAPKCLVPTQSFI